MVGINTGEIKVLKKNQDEIQDYILRLMEGQHRIPEGLKYEEELPH